MLDDNAAALRAGRTVSLGTSDDGAFRGYAPQRPGALYVSGAHPAPVTAAPFGSGMWGDSVRPMVVLGRRFPENRGAFQLPAATGAPR